MTRIVTLGGIALDLDSASSFRMVDGEGLVGWDDGPAIRSGLQPKSQQDGAWDAAGATSERVVDIYGLVQGTTPADAYAVAHDLAALRPQSVHELLVVNDTIGALSALTRVTIGVKPAWINETDFTYDIQVTAPDPLKYGPPTFGTATLASATPGAGLVYPLVYPLDYGIPPGVTPGAVLVGNEGTASYWPRLRIDGPVTNPVVQLVESGAWVKINGTIQAGQWVDMDMANRRCLLNGQVSIKHWPVTFSGDWLAVPSGGGSVAWTANTASASALLSVWSNQGAWA